MTTTPTIHQEMLRWQKSTKNMEVYAGRVLTGLYLPKSLFPEQAPAEITITITIAPKPQ